ncbi:MAG: hypothetical protein D6691_08325 [Candidatus Hydrogenedentota bacterium]|uniref:Phage protein n=1 Tax=Sumerlaea chitinivorans TaxID=2250252 RepID=A0A2Z4Y8F1_SUMC1|nr:Phage protein [Candidatus Sumerlaea chitinivorans]RMH26207.1 MAG: hypothetical protein D6691_08325 [Candidatus Hydrogenedentota bacterium]
MIFAYAFFPHLCRYPFSRMHVELFERYDTTTRSHLPYRAGKRFALAAPRGYAKSTLHSLILPLADLCFRREQFIVIVSATFLQAATRLRALRAELASNPALRAAFPHLAQPPTEANRQTLCVAGMRISAFGAGAEMRGLTHNGWRPTKIILDDVEDSERVLSARLRDATEAWFHEVIVPLGDTTTHIEVVGTLLHRESLLAKLLHAPAFETRLYRAVEAWPDREDLWAEWRRLRSNPEDPQRTTTATQFFHENREAMLRGGCVLWPEKESLPQLMELMLTQGRVAFFQEKQNEPPAGAGALFDVEGWQRFTIREDGQIVSAQARDPAIGSSSRSPRALNDTAPATDASAEPKSPNVRELEVVGFLDPALGGGDYAAIATVGRDRRGVLYVLDVWMARVPPAQQVARAFELHSRWGYSRFGFEANAFQVMLTRAFELELQHRVQAHRPAQMRFVGIKNRAPKATRIAALEPLAAAGWLRFHEALSPTFLHEAAAYPCGQTDDGLDAVAGAVALLTTHFTHRVVSTVAIPTRRHLPNF